MKDIISERYWLKKLEGDLVKLNFGKPFSTLSSIKRLHKVEITKSFIEEIGKVTNKSDIGQYCYFIAAFNLTLFKYTNQNDILTTIPEFKAPTNYDPENILFIRQQIERKATIKSLLNSCRTSILECRTYQYNADKLIESLRCKNAQIDRSTFFQFGFVDETLQNKNSVIESFDLIVSLSLTGTRPSFSFEFDDKFDLGFITQFGEHYKKILYSLINNFDSSVEEIELLDVIERKELLEGLNTGRKFESQAIYGFFESKVLLDPNKPAVFFRKDFLTYSELNVRVNKLSNHLISAYSPDLGSVIGVCLGSSFELLISILAILKTGCSVLPIVSTDPKERTKQILDDSKVGLIITEENIFDFLQYSGDVLYLSKYKIQIENQSALNPKRQVDPLKTAYVIYTSGSTGRPKGVCLSHNNLCNLFSWFSQAFSFSQEDVLAQKTTISFVDSIVELLLPVTFGTSSVFLRPYDTINQDAENLLNWLKEINTTIIQFVPSVFDFLYQTEDLSKLQTLKTLILSGEAVKKTYALPFEVYNLYGCSECTAISTAYHLEGDQISIGRPIDNTCALVLNEQLELVPKGAEGELFIGGDGVSLGYLNNKDLTSERFVKSPFTKGIIYKTGDIVKYAHDGSIEYIGRRDQQVKIRGLRIELGEIQKNLLLHKNILDAVVLVKEIEGDKEINAYIIKSDLKTVIRNHDIVNTCLHSIRPTEEAYKTLKAEDVKEFLNEKIPAYMIPNNIIFLNEFPTTSSYKVDKKALSELEINKEIACIAPKNSIEERLLLIWQEILRKEQISTNDKFTDLGGHSLKATRMLSKIKKEFDVELKLRDIFNSQSIEALAQRISESCQTKFEIIPVLAEQDYYNVSHAQKRMWIFDQREVNSTVYNLCHNYLLKGELNIQAFNKAFQSLIERHESLRTTFALVNGEVKQKVHPTESIPFHIKHIDYISLNAKEQWTEIKKEIDNETLCPFSLCEGPLLRVKLLSLKRDENIFLLSLHHIICDGWSMNIFFSDLFSLYNSYRNNKEPGLVSLPIQFKDFADWHNKKINSDGSSQKKYWNEKLSGDIPLLTLPIDFPRTGKRSYEGAHFNFFLNKGLSAKLRKFNQEMDVTIYTSMVALIKVLLYKYSGQEDIIIGSPASGRGHESLERQIGVFLNNLVLRDTIKGEETFIQFLKKVKNTILESSENADYPYDRLVEDLEINSPSDRNPFYDVLVVMSAEEAFSNEQSQDVEADLQVQIVGYDPKISKLDLTFFISDLEEIVVNIEYSTGLFLAKTIKNIAEDFQNFLEYILSNPGTTLDDIKNIFKDEIKSQEHLSFSDNLIEELVEDF